MIYRAHIFLIISSILSLTLPSLNILTHDGNTVLLYSHGLGETATHNDANIYRDLMYLRNSTIAIPAYDDGGINLSQLTLYTKNSVLKWCKKAQECIITHKNTIAHAFGRSCGAGTMTNALYFLCHFNKHKKYFNNTDITDTSAKKIITAINKGSLAFHVPFFDIQKVLIVSSVSLLLSYSTLGIACFFGMKMIGATAPVLTSMLCMLPCTTLLKLHKPIKKMYSSIIPHFIHRCISSRFNPYHITPLQALEGLRGHITCPVFIHVAVNDELLNTGKHIKYLYDIFCESSRNVQLVLSTDNLHDDNCTQFKTALNDFYKNLGGTQLIITSEEIATRIQQKPTALIRWHNCIQNIKDRT